MELPWKKKKDEFSEEDLLQELEKETAELQKETDDLKKPPAMPPPPGRPPMPPLIIQKPVTTMPMPSKEVNPDPPAQFIRPQQSNPIYRERRSLSEKEMGELPLYMKVEEYDKIVTDLNTLVGSLKDMEQILEKLSELEKRQTEETDKWREQLESTKDQLKELLENMPATGRIKGIIGERRKHQQKEKFKQEVSGLQQDLSKASVQPMRRPDQLGREVQELRDSIGAVQGDMKSLHDELKVLADVAKQKIAEEQKGKSPSEAFKPEYKKTEFKKPW